MDRAQRLRIISHKRWLTGAGVSPEGQTSGSTRRFSRLDAHNNCIAFFNSC
jgi:hypothetical protein